MSSIRYTREMLQLWNTLHHKMEPFKPVKEGHIGLYTCGPTVYNPVTLGNWRAFIFDDIVKRSFEMLGFTVTHVMNITDVGHLTDDASSGEDKVEREARKTGKTAWDIARMHEEAFLSQMSKLGICKPDIMPRATEHIPEQIALIQELEKKGFTYRIGDGIYFDTRTLASYGSLSGQKLEEKEAGARVEQNSEKRHPADFALWKFSPSDEQRQMEWESPWGIGFPGWHIECSAMSVKYLGQPFDVHCGGVDHIAVHHENEIAQSEAAYGKPLAHYWLHNEFLLVDGGRMGKSLGNAYTLDDVVARRFNPLAYRYFCLNAHYRSKLNFTWDGLVAAAHALTSAQAYARTLSTSGTPLAEYLSEFKMALENDLHTPQAIATMWDMLKSIAAPEDKGATLARMDEVLGCGFADLIGKPILVPEEILALARTREAARASKDWKASDELRDQIASHGWTIEDARDGSYRFYPKHTYGV